MILTAHQPLYLPWLGFFHKVILADMICILDDVQFSDGDFINRNRIKGANGPQWLTIPIEKKNHLKKTIREIRIVDDGWQKRHVATLRHAYARAPFFNDYVDEIESLLLQRKWEYLIDLDLAFLDFAFRHLDISTQMVLSSSLAISERKSDLVLKMCQKLGASSYISGENGLDYLDLPSFSASRIRVAVQKYISPTYSHVGEDSIASLSFLDLLFNMGPHSRDVLMSGNAKSISEMTEVGMRDK